MVASTKGKEKFQPIAAGKIFLPKEKQMVQALALWELGMLILAVIFDRKKPFTMFLKLNAASVGITLMFLGLLFFMIEVM